MTADFRSILNKKREDIEDPKILPAGTYTGIIKAFEPGESMKKKTPFIRLTYDVTGAGEGVDEALLAQVGLTKKDGTPRQLTRDDYYLGGDAEARLRNLIDSCIGKDWTTLGEGIESLIGQDVYITIAHRMGEKKPGEDPDTPAPVYVDIVRVVGTHNQ